MNTCLASRAANYIQRAYMHDFQKRKPKKGEKRKLATPASLTIFTQLADFTEHVRQRTIFVIDEYIVMICLRARPTRKIYLCCYFIPLPALFKIFLPTFGDHNVRTTEKRVDTQFRRIWLVIFPQCCFVGGYSVNTFRVICRLAPGGIVAFSEAKFYFFIHAGEAFRELILRRKLFHNVIYDCIEVGLFEWQGET